MKAKLLGTMRQVGWLALMALVANEGLAQTFRAAPELGITMNTIKRRAGRTTDPVELARVTPRLDGTVAFIGAPVDHHFLPEGSRFVNATTAAQDFVQRNRQLLGVASTSVRWTASTLPKGRRGSIVRLAQSYADIPVYAAEIKVQVNTELGVEAVLSNVLRNTRELDAGRLKTNPTLTAEEAQARVRNALAAEAGRQTLELGKPELVLFDPDLFEEDGPVRLAWQVNGKLSESETLDDEVFVDAHSGEVFDRIPNLHSAVDREVYDAGLDNDNPGTLRRDEGDPPSAVADVNAAYTALGQVYDFYKSFHGRESWDGKDGKLSATCRYCTSENQGSSTCTYVGMTASWSSSKNRMYYQPGSAVDDITGHEVTHGITRKESGLKYKNQSGAINESLSDIWGEFIDLTNGTGDDSAAVRWLLGEDIPQALGTGFRSLADPPTFNNPDRVGSPLYQPSSDKSDNGGVHNNSGVNNKLAYLLTDGDTFNGQTVKGMGISRVADLYYEAQTGLLTPSSGWTDLYHALQQAAINLGWTVAERNNLFRACRAVEIAAPETYYVNQNKACLLADGLDDSCGSGEVPFLPQAGGPFRLIAQSNDVAQPGDILKIATGNYNEKVVINKRLKIVPTGGTLVIGK